MPFWATGRFAKLANDGVLLPMKVPTEADCIALANLCHAYSTLMNKLGDPDRERRSRSE
jgi:hypothetical protein